MTGPVRRCDTCRHSEVLVHNGHRVCQRAEVNVPTPAFLAGAHGVARSCILERGTKRGACGPAGALWQPRLEDVVLGPAAGLDRLDV